MRKGKTHLLVHPTHPLPLPRHTHINPLPNNRHMFRHQTNRRRPRITQYDRPYLCAAAFDGGSVDALEGDGIPAVAFPDVEVAVCYRAGARNARRENETRCGARVTSTMKGEMKRIRMEVHQSKRVSKGSALQLLLRRGRRGGGEMV